MKLVIGANVTAELRRGNETIELSNQELLGLRDLLPAGNPKAAEAALRRLFSSSLLEPDLPRVSPVSFSDRVLSSEVAFRLDFKLGDVTSEVDLALTLGCDTRVLTFVQALARVLTEAAQTVCAQALALGSPAPREKLRRLLERLVERSLASRPELAGLLVLERSDVAGLSLHASTGVESFKQPVRARIVVLGGDGGTEILVALEELPAVACLLAWLSQGSERPEFDPAWLTPLSARTFASKLLVADVLTALVDRPVSRLAFAARGSALSALHLGHAGVVIDAGTTRILIDPFFAPHAPWYELQPLLPAELGKIDVVLFTHHHGDHILAPALLGLPRDTLIVVPEDGNEPVRPRYRQLFEAFGFSRIQALSPGQSLELADDTWIDGVPFLGEARNLLGFGAVLYAVSRRGRSILFHADSAPDTDGASLLDGTAIESLRERRGSIDVIYGSWWQQHQLAFELSRAALLSRRMSSAHWLDAAETCAVTSGYVRRLVQRADAKLFMLYAELGEELFLPAGSEGPYLESISCAWLPVEQFKAEVEDDASVRVVRSVPRLVVHLPEEGDPYLDTTRVAPSRVERVLREAGSIALRP